MTASRIPQVDAPQIGSVFQFAILANERLEPAHRDIPNACSCRASEIFRDSRQSRFVRLCRDHADQLIQTADDFAAAVAIDQPAITKDSKVIQQRNRDVIITLFAFQKGTVRVRFGNCDAIAGRF